MGALSKLDEFLLNSHVRTCSVAVPGTSVNSNSGNQELTGDRSLGDPCPKAVLSTYHSHYPDDPGQVTTHHMVTGATEETRNRHHIVTGVQEETRYCSPGFPSGKQKRRRAPQVSHNFEMKTPLQYSKQTGYC